MMKRVLQGLLAILTIVVCTGPVHAFPVVSILPAQQIVEAPGAFSVTVNISGLQADDPARLLGAFSVDLLFDPAVLSYFPSPPVGWGGALGDVAAGQAVTTFDPSTPGVIHLGETSLLEANADTCVFCTGPFLADLQGNSFKLVTLSFFDAASSGSTVLNLASPVFVDANGFPIPLGGLNGATIRVPEPGSIAMLAMGVALMGWVRRRRSSLV